MTVEPAVFTCSICGEPSTSICAYCTKDACENHRCTRCKRCSDCCECEVPLSEQTAAEHVSEPNAVPEPATPPTPIRPPLMSSHPNDIGASAHELPDFDPTQ